MGYTKEPWILRENNAVQIPDRKDPEAPYIFSKTNFDSANWRDNARRAVECVNACKGINPEAVPEMLEALEELRDLALRRPDMEYVLAKVDQIINKAKGGI